MDAPNIIVESRNKPLKNVSAMVYGNKPVDGGFLIIEEEDYAEFIKKEPGALKYIKPFMGADEYINNKKRWCLWLINADPSELKKLPLVLERIEKVRQFRLASKKEATKKWADYPSRFIEIRQPETEYILIPCVTSERRKYIPIGFIDKSIIVNNKVQLIPNGTLYEFAILTSTMHMAWMRYVCGRLKSDYNYSKDIVYNNFPWPEPTDKQRADIEQAAQVVLDARAHYLQASLADLYDPNTMPADLVKAHAKLDKLVEKTYSKSFDKDADRVAFLFEKYRQLTSTFLDKADKNGKKKNRKK